MKIPIIKSYDIKNENIDIKVKQNEILKQQEAKMPLPFLNIDIEKNDNFPNISKKVKNAKSLINSQTDKLLIEGFEGTKEDFKKCYYKIGNIKLNKIANIKKRKLNKFFIKDGYSSIKITKTKEFNLSDKRKNKIFGQIKLIKGQNNSKIKLHKKDTNLFNNIFNNNSSYKGNQMNSTNSINEHNIYNSSVSQCNNNIFDKSNFYTINNNYGNTFYFYKKNTEKQHRNLKKKKNNSKSFNEFMTLRNILNNTSQNITNINTKLKKYIIRNNSNLICFNSTKNESKQNILLKLNKSKDNKIKNLLDSLEKKDENRTLKQIKKDDGVNTQNIWIKKSTANLISFGKSFINLDDNHFYQERKRIMEDYPKIEKEANISFEEVDTKNKEKILLKKQKIKMDVNSHKINNLTKMTNLIFTKLNDKVKDINRKNKFI